MIKSFRNKALQALFEEGKAKGIREDWWKRILMILDHLDAATGAIDCQGVKDFHQLSGDRKGTFSMHVNGNWCITFKFEDEDVVNVDMEDYH